MQVVDPAFFQIRQILFDCFDIAAEVLDIQHHSQKPVRVIPVLISLTFLIDLTKYRTPFPGVFLQHLQEIPESLLIVIKLHIEPFQFLQKLFFIRIIKSFDHICHVLILRVLPVSA